jgi:hypothetical protein
MPNPKTPEEVRRLKERGIFDVGTYYSAHGLNRIPKKKTWDEIEEEN